MSQPIRKIVCATDLTSASEAALRSSLELARQLNVPLVVLHTVEAPYRPPVWFVAFSDSDHAYLAEIARREESAALRLMGEQIAAISPPGPGAPRVDVAIRRGIPSDAIAAATVELGADLLVVGTHARTGLQHALLGSVAERLVRTAPCQVLVVRQRDKTRA